MGQTLGELYAALQEAQEFAAKTPAQAKLERAGKRYWSHGEGAARIRWGEGGDFLRCVRLVTEEGVPAHMAKGYCAERHHEALGVWPGQER